MSAPQFSQAGGDLEAALETLVAALVGRIEAKLAARIAAAGAATKGATKGATTDKTVGVRAMSDQQLRDRIGIARARGEIDTLKSCVGELKRRDSIANNFVAQNSGED